MILPVILLTGIFLLSIPLSYKLYWKYAGSILILVSAGYFLYVPPVQDDLYRHYLLLDQIRIFDLGLFDTSNHYWSENPIFVMILFLFSLFPVNATLPFFVGCVYYLASLYLFRKAALENGIKTREIIASIILLMVTNYIIFSGIRNALCVAIFFIGLYMDLVMKSRKGIVLYIVATLIHTAGFLYILIRIILSQYEGKKKILILGCCFFLPFVLVTYSIPIAGALSGIPLLGDAFSRFMAYTIENRGMEVSSNWRYFYAISYLFILFIVYYYEVLFDEEKKYKRICNFILILIVIIFGFWGERSLFNRQAYILFPLGIMYYILLKNRVFKVFPVTAIKSTGNLRSCISILLCFLFCLWGIINFMVLMFVYYPDFIANFIF